ncbi:MAG: PH domain-containing protein [Candidatus Dojkabacteria bacterium]
MVHTFKPDKRAFILLPLARTAIIFAGILIVGVVISLVLSTFFLVIILLVVLIILYALITWNKFVQFRKEVYEFHSNKIVHRSGSIINDSLTELPVRNITNVSQIFPFIEFKLFGTNHILIDSAASGASSIVLSSLQGNEGVITLLKKNLDSNGLQVDESQLIQHMKPSRVGFAISISKTIFNALLFLLIFGVFDIGLSTILSFVSPELALITLPLFLVVLLVVVLVFFVKYQDIAHTDYFLYEEVLVYRNGFMTREYSFMPAENLTDTSLTQDIFEKIFNVQNIVLNTKGTSRNIAFKYLKDAQSFSEQIRSVIRGQTLHDTPATTTNGDILTNVEESGELHSQDVPAKDQTQGAAREQGIQRVYDNHTTVSFRSNPLRACFASILSLFFFIPFGILVFLFPVIILGLVPNIVYFVSSSNNVFRVLFRTFHIEKQSIRQTYSFLSTQTLEFRLEKITSFVVSENYIDRLFNTVTITLFSQGAGETIQLLYINKNDTLIPLLYEKIGIHQPESTLLEKFHSKFSARDWFKNNSIILVTLFMSYALISPLLVWYFTYQNTSTVIMVAVAGGIGVVPAGIFCAQFVTDAIRMRFSKLLIYDDHFAFSIGKLFYKMYVIKSEFIRECVSLQYPFTDTGALTIHAAGGRSDSLNEANQQTNKNLSITTNTFTIHYLCDVFSTHDLLDAILKNFPRKASYSHDKVEMLLDPSEVYRTRPVVANASIRLLPLAIFFFLIYIGAFLYVILRIKNTFYIIQKDRIVGTSGIIAKKQSSVLYRNIDYITQKQGALNKLFGNGTIQQFTDSGGEVTLKIQDIQDFSEFYTILNQQLNSPPTHDISM